MSVAIENRYTGAVIATVEDTDSLREAVIRLTRQGASLQDANLRDSDLRDSDLRGSDLRGSDLSGSDLAPIRDDLFAVLSHSPAEVPALIAALEQGRVNGSTYSDGECGCLVGTLAMASGADPSIRHECEVVHGLRGDGERPIERFFLAIQKGSTPESSQPAKLAHEWASEWLSRMQAAFAKGGEA